MAASLDHQLAELVGADFVRVGEAVEDRFLEDPRRRWHKRPLGLVRPASTEQVAAVIRLCHQRDLPVVTRGGGTGLVGGASMTATGRELLLSLDRMRAIRKVDAPAAALTVEAGVTLEQARSAAAEYGLDVPLRLASGGSASIGGILATNAGGNTTIRHGNARRMALGLELVLADGRVLNLLSDLRKDNTGYDIRQLMIGSEGTLGIITAATLALLPLPRQQVTAWCALPSPAAALALLGQCRHRLGETLTAFELLPGRALELVLDHRPTARDPLERRYPWYVLIDAASSIDGDWLEQAATALFADALAANHIDDAVIASSDVQAEELWLLRESIPAAQKQSGASIKHDLSVPISAIPEMIDRTVAALRREMPGIRPCIFGHVGDGNLHFNLNRPEKWSDQAFMAEEQRLNAIVFDQVDRLGGSIAAEHGIGQLRRDQLAARGAPVKLDVLRRIKRALDPKNLLNPNKVVALAEQHDPGLPYS
ncbi:MAG: FAD-binding oxidoreductase [Wenzhouxiangellaceae bacterium]|nr:FAD-binding oxidoreductase [Wenzhouxiangellaceae bacterium]